MEWGGPSARADVVLNQGVRKGLGLVTFVQRPEDGEEGELDSCHKSLFSTLGNFDATSAGARPFPRALISHSLVPWPCLLGGLQPQAGEASGIECESFARLPWEDGQGPPRGTLAVAGSFVFA